MLFLTKSKGHKSNSPYSCIFLSTRFRYIVSNGRLCRQNILISYTHKSFAARIELVLRESQVKINVEILQIGLAKIGLAKYYLILDSTLPFS